MSTYTPIATQTLGSAAASVTFSSIPQGYTDLVLTITGNNNQGVAYISTLTFNGDTSSNYSYTRLVGTGALAQSSRDTSANYGFGGWTNNETSQMILGMNHIQNYSNSTTYKTWLGRGGDQTSGTGSRVYAMVGLWRKTEAITSIKIEIEAGTYDAGSTFSIYGIQVGDKAQKAQGGNIVTSDGTYVYHTFTSSGSFIPSAALTVDYLVVAGGGGGGGGVANTYQAGGGGAGGMRCTVTGTGGSGSLETALSLTSGTAYVATVGSGGAGGTAGSSTGGTNGGDSIFATITSLGGGGGGTANNASNGGSGGGAGINTKTFGTGNSSQGYNGGNAYSSNNTAGGGGGAAVAGETAPNDTYGGAGGNGRATSISGSSITYAGGGGGGVWATGRTGGSGGTGGGGSGGTQSAGGNGTVNLGAGGGGAAATGGSGYAGGNGGSGIVIIRYLA